MSMRPFPETLRDIRGGELLDELGLKLQELVQAVQITGKAGKLTLAIDVKPMEKNAEAVVVTDEVKLKKPEVKAGGTIMFPTPEGNLTRRSQRQDELPGIQLAADRSAA